MPEPIEQEEQPKPKTPANKPTTPPQAAPVLTQPAPGPGNPQPAKAPTTPSRVGPTGLPQPTPQRSSFAQDFAADRAQGATPNARAADREFTYWEDPKRVARYRNLIRSQPPGYELPPGFDADQIEQAYQYMKFRNDDKPWTEWKGLAEDDPGTGFLRSMSAPPPEFQMPGDRDYSSFTEPQPIPDTDPFGDWDNLKPWQQLYLGIMSPQPGLKDRPEWTRFTAAAGQGLLAVPAAAAIGAIGGPVGALGLGGAALLTTAYQSYTGTRIPVVADVLDIFNVLSVGAMRTIGTIGQIENEGLDTILKELPAAWKAAQLNYVVQEADLLNVLATLAGDRAAGSQEVWQIAQGYADPQALAAGQLGVVRGADALKEARKRILDGEDPLLVYQDFNNRFGDSGTFNDFILQTLIDPTNLVPGAVGKAGEFTARRFGNERLALAFGEGVGNPVIDMIPFGDMIGRPFGLHGSEGPLQSFQKYQGWVRTGYFPGGDSTITPASQLSSFEKWAGGLDEQGQIREVQTRTPTGNKVKDFVTYLNTLTPEAQASAFMSMFHDNVNVILSLAEKQPEEMVKFLRQAAAVDPVEVGQVGQAVLSSPVTATIAQTLRDVLADNWDQEMLLRWTEGQPKRDMLEKIARALNERPADVLEMYRDTPDVLLSRVAQVSGIEGTRDSLKALFDVFTGEDALPWNINEFRARLAVTVFDKMDAQLAARYGIKPDAAVFRLSQTLKGMQSLLLLGLNPSYFINNQLNNMVTRAATGVFGYMSPRQIKETFDRMGIIPDRLADAISPDGAGQAGTGILKAKQADDWIAKTQGVVSAVNNKLGVFSKFSSAGERLESSNAYAIGMLKFWNKAWRRGKGLRQMHPTVEAMLDRQYPGMKEIIYQVAEAGMNMDEIEGKLFGEAIRPEVQAVIDDAARQLFPDHPEDGAGLLRETGIQAKLEKLLTNAETPEQVRYAFERVKKDIQNVVDEAAKIEEANRAEDIQNKMTTEGIGAIREALEQVSRRIDRQRAEVGEGWTRAANYAAQTYAGILKGLGKSATDSRIKERIIEIRKAGQEFARERTKIVTALKKAKGPRANELRLQLGELHDRYKARIAQEQARLDKLLPGQPTPEPRPLTDRMKALNETAERYGLIDAQGRPVARYLMNVVNARRKKGEKYTDPEQIPLDEAETAAAAHRAKHYSADAERARRLKLTVDDIVRIADEDARAAEIQAAGMLTRRLVREQLAEAFDANDAETEAAIALMDAHADRVARMQGRTPSAATRDAWYATRIARITGSEDPGAAINNYYQEAYGGLVALHNLKAENLIEADRLGGMPAPSIAVLKSSKRFTDYGDITLIGRRDLIDPQARPGNRVFAGDVYSPTRPTPVYDPVAPEQAAAVVDRFRQADREAGDYFSGKLWDALVRDRDELQALTLFTKHGAPRIVFLRERGITVDTPQAQPFTVLPFTGQPELVAWLDANAERLRDARRSQGEAFTRDPLYIEFTQAVRRAVEASGQDAAAYMDKITAPTGEVTGGYFDKVLQDYTEIKKGPRPDMVAARAQAETAIISGGLKDEYNKWALKVIRGMFQEPKIVIDGERLPYNLENVTRYMTRQNVRGAVDDGPLEGRTTAQGAPEFSNVDEIRQASGRLVSKDEANSYDYELNLKVTPYLSQVESFYFDVDKWNPEADALKALGDYLQGGRDRDPERMRQALEANGFEVDVDEVLELAIDAAEAAADAPAAYFEAKPQRAVNFNEFAGAVVPENAPPEVFEILERRGIEYRTYTPDSDVSRERAVAKFYERDNVLFQKAGHHRDNILKIREMGFVPVSSVRAVFEGGTPGYVRGLIRYILEKHEKYKRGEMTVRDVAKAYLATISSQGSDALPWATVRQHAEAAGIRFERDGAPIDVSQFLTRQGIKEMIRPEEYAGLWLWTDQGRAALDALERGEITDAWRQFVDSRGVFGRFGRGVRYQREPGWGSKYILDDDGNKIPVEEPGDWFIKKGQTSKRNLADIQAITDEINAAKGDTKKISQIIAGMAGVSEGKTAFVKHMIGFGDETVVDTQQANFWHEFLSDDPRMTKDLTDTLLWGNWGKRGVIEELKSMIEETYWQLRAEGIGADIPPEVFTYVMHHWLWSVQKGAVGDQGTTHAGMYMALELAQEAKGGVHFLNDGRAVIRSMQAGDVSTMVHEIGHVFRRDLDDGDLDAVAQIGGLSGAAELRELEARFVRGEIVPGDPEYQRYVDAEEYFARGWERYLAEGDAPTPALRKVFESFTRWMVNIYRRLRASVHMGRREVSGFGQQEDFQVGGRTVDVRAQVNGRSLRDIFDEMISDGRFDEDAEAAAQAAARVDPLTLETPQETNLLRGPVKNLPPQVQKAMAQVAEQILGELAPSRQVVLADNSRVWEGPQWYKDAIESEKRAGKKADDLKSQYMGQLRSIISGKDTGKSEAGPFIKSLILERARGQADIESNIQPAILRYLGETEQMFELYGDAILSSEEPQLREMFGDEWEQVLDEVLEWSAGRDDGSPLPADQTDIMGQPVEEPTPELAQAAQRNGPEWQRIAKERLEPGDVRRPGKGFVATDGDYLKLPDRMHHDDIAREVMNEDPNNSNRGILEFGMSTGMIRVHDTQPDWTTLQLFRTATAAQRDTIAAIIRASKKNIIIVLGVFGDSREFEPGDIDGVMQYVSGNGPNSLYQGAQRPDPVAPAGGTPTPEPYGSILDEVTADSVMPMLDAAEARYIEQLGRRPLKMGDLDEQAQAEVRKYLKQVSGDLASTKYAAMTYGQQMRDQSLLNYNRRYGIDNMLDLAFPYQFWYTRSLIEWGKRMVDRPSWFGTYARMQDAQEKMAANMPTRLKGKVRIPAPWLPEWAGGGLWVDPTAKLFPFAPFGQPFEEFAKNTDQVQRRAEQVLDELVEADKITPADAAAAKESRSGSAWAQAMTQAQLDLDKQGSPLNMVNMMMSPALWWTAGANLLHGKPAVSSPLPITKTASAVETATRGTLFEPVGKLAGLAAWPEKAARRAGGLSEFGDWGNWYVDRQLANMAAEGVITAEQAKMAMIERSGPVFDDAYQRVQYEQMLQVPGAAMLNQAASGQLGGALQAIPTLIFSGSLFPEGELKLNGLKDDFAKAMQDRQRGDEDAINRFFEDHPEYEARLALNDEPEERLRQFLISEVWDKYGQLESANRKAAADQMGEQFRAAFLNKETRSYDSIPVEVLARWTQMLGGPVPDVEATAGAIENPEPPVELYAPETAAAIGAYQDERRAKFPNYYAQQSAYFAVPEADRAGRKRIFNRFPELSQYWDWKRQYKNEHPELADYFEGNTPGRAQAGPSVTPQELAQVDGILMRQLLAWQMFGQPLTSGAHAELTRLSKGRASSEEYARQILASMMSTQ